MSSTVGRTRLPRQALGSRLAVLALALALLGLIAGGIWAGSRFADGGRRPTPATAPTATPALPQRDVPGADIAGLPRYPGAMRAAYERADRDVLRITRAGYLTPAPLAAVHDFYRGVFATRGWTEADLDFSHGRRHFFVIAGAREAHVTLTPRGDLTEIAIEVSEPRAAPPPATAPTGTPPPPIAPSPGAGG